MSRQLTTHVPALIGLTVTGTALAQGLEVQMHAVDSARNFVPSSSSSW